MDIYVVQRGDTLTKIADRYNVDVSKIISVNEIENDGKIVPGEAIVIPTATRRYVVKPGDTLWSIAQKTGTTVEAIIQMNAISDPQDIQVGMSLVIPSHGQKPTIETNGFVYDMGSKGAEIVRRVADHLTYIAPFAYGIKENGDLNPLDDTAVIQAGYNHNAVPILSISNFTSQELGSDIAHAVLVNDDAQNRLLENMISVSKEKGYQGVNIDFENVYPYDRGSYNQFLQRAVQRLHNAGLFVSTSLAPKTSGTQQGLLYEAHDYEAHGRIVDFVVLMTYEWGYRFGPPQAISPINQIRAVIDYAVTVIPRNKIMLGFQIYARDWLIPHQEGQEAETFSPKEARERAVDHQVSIQYNERAQSPFYQYTDNQGKRHEVWYEDARSAQAKFNLVKEYGLRGISYWVLGYSYPQNWTLLEDNFNIRKRT